MVAQTLLSRSAAFPSGRKRNQRLMPQTRKGAGLRYRACLPEVPATRPPVATDAFSGQIQISYRAVALSLTQAHTDQNLVDARLFAEACKVRPMVCQGQEGISSFKR